jgi:biopolymer transport protein ExbD
MRALALGLLACASGACARGGGATEAGKADAMPVFVAHEAGGPLVVTMAPGQILVDGAKALPLPSRAALVKAGVEAKYKRGSYVVPLATAVKLKDGCSGGKVVIEGDASIPYALFAEVLFTLGQCGVARFDLRALSGDGGSRHAPAPPSAPSGALDPASTHRLAPKLELRASIAANGVTFVTAAGNVATGCARLGAGTTVKKKDGRQDLEALVECAARLKRASADPDKERHVNIAATRAVDFESIVEVTDALQDPSLFPEVDYGLPL